MPRHPHELSDTRPGLSPFRYGLSSLLIAMAILGGWLAVSKYLGVMAMTLSIVAVLSIVAHMASTAIGKQLRQNGRGGPANVGSLPEADQLHSSLQSIASNNFAPTTELSHRRPLERRGLLRGILAGAIIGAVVGGSLLFWFVGDVTDNVSLLFGAGCSAVLGGLGGFAVASFAQVVHGALRQAHGDGAKN